MVSGYSYEMHLTYEYEFNATNTFRLHFNIVVSKL